MARRKFQPLPPAALHIMLSLADGDRHGYGIMQEVAAQTGGKVRLGPGTLYGTIKALLEGGFIAEAGERPDDAAGSERRKYYTLTGAGRALAGHEVERMAQVLRIAKQKRVAVPSHA